MRKRSSTGHCPTADGLPPSIVFADNDTLVREAIGELLRSKDYNVYLACDGLEALTLCRRIKPDYVILDIMMPKLDGARVCWLIRQDPELRETPVIAFSSLSARDFRGFQELSADAYVAKGTLSVSFQHILEAIAHIDARGRGSLSGGVFGYDELQPRQLVEEMLEERRRHATALRALGDGVLELDRKGTILSATPGACEILGKREARIIGEPFASFCASCDQRAVSDVIAELFTAESPERCRMTLQIDEAEISVLLCAQVEERECVGILVVMEMAKKTGERNQRTRPAVPPKIPDV